jgi:hypothetical protein
LRIQSTLQRDFFRGIIKKMGHELFGGLKNIEVIISK